MAKFKVGDRVRLTVRSTYDRWGAKGEEGTVLVEDDGNNDCYVDFDRAGRWYAQWNILELVEGSASAATLTIQAGKYYKTRDGRKVGPLHTFGSPGYVAVTIDGEDRVFAEAGGKHQYGITALDLVAEWEEPAAVAVATAAFKVGDRVRFTEHNPNCGREFGAEGDYATVEGNVGYETALYGKQVTVRLDKTGTVANAPIKALALAEPTTPTIGDWVRTEDGRIGIVFLDDGTDCVPLAVGFTGDSDEMWEWFDPDHLTVVPPGTTKAANDNAPILAEIDELEQRLAELRSALA